MSTILSTREQITQRLRDDVMSGRLPTGQRVGEAQLAEQFGVSRGPIREAISLLTSEGIFVAKQNCGVTVAPPAPEPIRDLILPIRRTIEVYAFRQIYDSLTDEDFRVWNDLIFEMERAARNRDAQQIPTLDVAFHRYVVERAGSPDLLAIWQTIVNRMRAHFWATVRGYAERGKLSYLVSHHQELLDVFRAGPKSAALKALERHIDEN